MVLTPDPRFQGMGIQWGHTIIALLRALKFILDGNQEDLRVSSIVDYYSTYRIDYLRVLFEPSNQEKPLTFLSSDSGAIFCTTA